MAKMALKVMQAKEPWSRMDYGIVQVEYQINLKSFLLLLMLILLHLISLHSKNTDFAASPIPEIQVVPAHWFQKPVTLLFDFPINFFHMSDPPNETHQNIIYLNDRLQVCQAPQNELLDTITKYYFASYSAWHLSLNHYHLNFALIAKHSLHL